MVWYDWELPYLAAVAHDPILRRLLPRIEERLPEQLTETEVQKVTQLEDPWGFLCRLGFETGMRWSEMAEARATDLQSHDTLRVRGTRSRKTRCVPVGSGLAVEIRQRVGRLSPYARSSVPSFNRQVRVQSGVRRFHANLLRFTFACRYLQHCGSLTQLQEILGYGTAAMTEKYAKIMAEIARSEARRVREERQRRTG